MKERPILFSGPMVRAILEGRKTQTRRVMKPQPVEGFSQRYTDNKPDPAKRVSYGWSWCKGTGWPHVDIFPGGSSLFRQFCPYGSPGERLWVRETFRLLGEGPRDRFSMFQRHDVQYRADGDESYIGKYHPSLHMPRRFSRLNLEVTGMRVERLQEISLNDVRAEGCEVREFWLFGQDATERQKTGAAVYGDLWRSINGAESWDANPWVWVVEFKRAPQ